MASDYGYQPGGGFNPGYGGGSDINSIRNLGMLSDSVIASQTSWNSAARPRLSGTS